MIDIKGVPRLWHRCGTCDEVFDSFEKLCEHEQVHVYPAEEQSEPTSAIRYRCYYYYSSDGFFEDCVEYSHRLNRGLPIKVPLPDKG